MRVYDYEAYILDCVQMNTWNHFTVCKEMINIELNY